MHSDCITCNAPFQGFPDIKIKNTAVAICGACTATYTRFNDDMTPEIGDTVDFIAADEFGITTGVGIIMRLFKNGKAIIHRDGRPYRTHLYHVLRKAR